MNYVWGYICMVIGFGLGWCVCALWRHDPK